MTIIQLSYGHIYVQTHSHAAPAAVPLSHSCSRAGVSPLPLSRSRCVTARASSQVFNQLRVFRRRAPHERRRTAFTQRPLTPIRGDAQAGKRSTQKNKKSYKAAGYFWLKSEVFTDDTTHFKHLCLVRYRRQTITGAKTARTRVKKMVKQRKINGILLL